MTSQNTREISYKEFRIPQHDDNRARSSHHITPILKSLQWLPVEVRINLKILLITYKILNGQYAGCLEPRLRNIIQQEHYDRHPVRYYAP